MIQITLSAEDIQELHYQRFHHPHPRVQLRMEVLWLKSQGIAHGTIAAIAGVSRNTVRKYLRMYLAGGIEGLKELTFNRPKSELAAHSSSIEESFREHPPASIKEAAQRIQALTGIQRGQTQVRKFMKDHGMTFRKVAMIPAKADPEVQEEFKKNLRTTA